MDVTDLTLWVIYLAAQTVVVAFLTWICGYIAAVVTFTGGLLTERFADPARYRAAARFCRHRHGMPLLAAALLVAGFWPLIAWRVIRRRYAAARAAQSKHGKEARA